MKKYIIILIIISFCSQITPAKNSSYKVSFSVGNFYIRTLKNNKWIKGSTGAQLKKGYVIKTGLNSQILIIRGSEKIKIKENTIVKIDDLLNSPKRKEAVEISVKKSRFIRAFLKEDRTRVTSVSAVRGNETATDPDISWSDDLDNEKPQNTNYLEKASKEFGEGNYSSAIKIIKKNFNKIPRKNINDANYLLGVSYFNNGNFEKCIFHMNKFNKKTKADDKRLHSSHFYMAISYNYMGNDRKSISLLNKFIQKYSGSELSPRAYYLIATIYRMKNRNKDALKYYEQLVKRYPQSDLYKESENEIKRIKKIR